MPGACCDTVACAVTFATAALANVFDRIRHRSPRLAAEEGHYNFAFGRQQTDSVRGCNSTSSTFSSSCGKSGNRMCVSL